MYDDSTDKLPDVIAVLEDCGIELPSRISQTNISIKCPFCDDKKRHLRFSLVSKVYFCPRCNARGNLVTFLAEIKNISTKEAYNILTSGQKYTASPTVQKKLVSTPAQDLASVQQRNAVYTALLGLLTLSDENRANLLDRGFTSQNIEKNGYKSMPVNSSRAIAEKLIKQGLALHGIPGFYTDTDGKWRFRCKDVLPDGTPIDSGMRGFLIPVRDSKGRIQGMQLRRDKGAGSKYIWLSSSDRENGTPAQSWCHYVGGNLFAGKVDEVLLTEGALKADAIHAMSGASVLAVMGVNATRELRNALARMKKAGVRTMTIAFDMDMWENERVEQAYCNVRDIIAEEGFRYHTLYWDKSKKGLDDYLVYRRKTLSD